MQTSPSTLPPELLAATQSLAETLLYSEPMVRYHQAKSRFDADLQARALLERLSAAQADLRVRQSNSGIPQTDIEQLRALQREVQSNPVIMEYAHSQQAAIAYLPEVNRVIGEMLGVDFASLAGPASC